MDPTVNIEIWGVGVNPQAKDTNEHHEFCCKIFLPSVEDDTALVKK